MSPEAFLDQLARSRLVSQEVLRELRAHIDESFESVTSAPVTAQKLADLLVKKRRLSKAQAHELLADPERRPPPAAPVEDSPSDIDLEEVVGDLLPDKPLALRDDSAQTQEMVAAAGPDGAATRSIGGGRTGFGRLFSSGRLRQPPKKVQGPQNPWDSPLMLLGGGALVLLALTGATAYYLIQRGGGDELLAMAQSDYRTGSYTQAIHKYDEFLRRFPNHPAAGEAVVQLGLARLRQTLQGSAGKEQTLALVKKTLAAIEGQKEFSAAQAELAVILPDFAERIARQARQAADAADARKKVDLGDQALALVMNTGYVPHRLRPDGRIADIRQTLAMVARKLQRTQDLKKALAAMDAAVVAGDSKKAYALRRGLLKQYPTLAGHDAVTAMVKRITLAERDSVTCVDKLIASSREEAASALVASLALAARRGPAEAASASAPVLVRARGAVFGLDAATGHLLWRRAVGFGAESAPVVAGSDDGNAALLVDSARNELVCVEAGSGRLRWRLPAGQGCLPPAIAGQQLLVATRSGVMLVVELATGKSARQVVFPQELSTAPAVHPRQPVVYQVGEHSSLYVISTDDLQCREVVYLGHAAGTVQVPPVVLARNLLIAENQGASSARLRVFSIGEDGGDLQPVQQIRLTGHVLSPPVIDGDRVVVATDRGQVKVLASGSADGRKPLIEIAELGRTSAAELVWYPLLRQGTLWLAGDQLAKFQVQRQSGRLKPEGLVRNYKGDTFVAPLQWLSSRIVHVRRQAGRDGIVVAAIDADHGRSAWETELTMKPAGEPLVDAERQEIAVMTSTGALFRFNAQAIRARVQDVAVFAGEPGEARPSLSRWLPLGNRRFVFTGTGPSDQVLYYDAEGSSGSGSLKWLRLPARGSALARRFRQGLLVPTKKGPIYWWDPDLGRQPAAPFQPPIDVEDPPQWQTPCVLADGQEFLAADARGKLYRVGVVEKPAPHLAALAQVDALAESLAAGPLVVDDHAVLMSQSGQLFIFQLPDLRPVRQVELPSPPAWGPERIGPHVLVVTKADDLLCIAADGGVAWRSALPYGPLAGRPIVLGEAVVLASRQGVIWSVDRRTGEPRGQADLRQPLATGPVPFGQRLVVGGYDGTLLVVDAL